MRRLRDVSFEHCDASLVIIMFMTMIFNINIIILVSLTGGLATGQVCQRVIIREESGRDLSARNHTGGKRTRSPDNEGPQ
jgi:hypothetical protein